MPTRSLGPTLGRSPRTSGTAPAGTTAVPETLVTQVETARAGLEAARAELAAVLDAGAPVPDRRAAYRRVTRAYEALEAPLRQAARATKGAPYGNGWYRGWRRWRHELSTVSAARVRHLFAISNDEAVLAPGSVRALDTGMSGPSVGDMLHGASVAPGTPAGYGVDIAHVGSGADHGVRRGVGGVHGLGVVEGVGAVPVEVPVDVDLEAGVAVVGDAARAVETPDVGAGAVVPA